MLTKAEPRASARAGVLSRTTLPLTLSVVALLLTVGCTHVITHSAPYYKHGPTQLEAPQGIIPEGTHVWVVGKEGTYTRVWTAGGVDAYVWNGAVMPLHQYQKTQRQAQQAQAQPGKPQPVLIQPIQPAAEQSKSKPSPTGKARPPVEPRRYSG